MVVALALLILSGTLLQNTWFVAAIDGLRGRPENCSCTTKRLACAQSRREYCVWQSVGGPQTLLGGSKNAPGRVVRLG